MNEEKIDIEYWFLSQYLLSMCQRYNINSNTLKFMWVCYLMEKIERFSLKKKQTQWMKDIKQFHKNINQNLKKHSVYSNKFGSTVLRTFVYPLGEIVFKI